MDCQLNYSLAFNGKKTVANALKIQHREENLVCVLFLSPFCSLALKFSSDNTESHFSFGE